MGVEEAGWRRFNVRDFGAAADGKTDSAAGIQKAIDACAAAGGGTAYVPPGEYSTGPIELKSNVRLEVEAGAVLIGSPRLDDYSTIRHLLYAENAENISLGGRGRIHGSGLEFLKRRGPDRDTPVRWRPGNMVTLVRCRNVRIEDLTLTDSPAWTVHPIDCENVTIRGLSILNGISEADHVPNSDGIDPDGCSNVRISDCFIQSGDDSIVLKISRHSRTRVCREVTVTNCVCVSTETALKIGSESHGEFRNITFSNCVVRDAGCGVGLWMRDGGLIDGWLVDNVAMTLPHDGVPVYFWCWPREEGGPLGTVRNVTVSNVSAVGDACAFLSGMKEKPLENVTLQNFRLFMHGGTRQKFHEDPPYPFQVWGHRRAPYDLFCRYVDNLSLRDIHLTWGQPEQPLWGSAIRCVGVRNLEIAGFEGRQSLGSQKPAIWLKDVRGAFLHSCRAPEGTGTFVKLEEGTEAVSLMNNDLHLAARAAETAPGVPPDALFEAGNRPPGR